MPPIQVINVQANSLTSDHLVEIRGADAQDTRMDEIIQSANLMARDQVVSKGSVGLGHDKRPFLDSFKPVDLLILKKDDKNRLFIAVNRDAQQKIAQTWPDMIEAKGFQATSRFRWFSSSQRMMNMEFCNTLRDMVADRLGGQVVEDMGPSLGQRLKQAFHTHQNEMTRWNAPRDDSPNGKFIPNSGRHQEPASLLARLSAAVLPEERVSTVESTMGKRGFRKAP